MWKKTFVSAFVAQIFSILGFSFAIPFLPFFLSELGIHDTGQQAFWSGIALSATGFTLCIFAPLWGLLADRYGRKVMVCRAMFAGTIILLLMSVVRTAGQLVICRLLQGIFTGTNAASIALVASVTPERRSGLTLGMMQAAVFIGAALGPLFGGVFADLFGYRAAFRAGAALVFLGGLLVLLMVKENFVPPDAEKSGSSMSFKKILAVNGFLAAVAIIFGVHLSNSIINPSFPLIVKDIVPSVESLNSITGFVLAAAAIAGALSSAVLGHMGDRWGQKKILISCCIAAAFASAGHFFASSLPSLFTVRILFGLSVAGMLPAANAMIYKIIDKKAIGMAYGAATSLSMTGFALGPFFGGALASATNLRIPFLVTALFHVMLAFFIFRFVKISDYESASNP
ncbi:MAG: MFS transporter [Candidatus Omnitrophica bacterium]|nr:MFS transporter [Candidatus Omnitrophota bacterium]